MEGQFSFQALKKAGDQAYRKSSFVEAGELYSKILEDCQLTMGEQNVIRGNRCLASQKSGNWQRAIDDAQACLLYDPSQLTAWYRFGISLITAKLPAEAIDALETAQAIDSRNPDVKAKLKKARQALRSQADRTSSDGQDAAERTKLQQIVRQTIDQAKRALKADFESNNAPDIRPRASNDGPPAKSEPATKVEGLSTHEAEHGTSPDEKSPQSTSDNTAMNGLENGGSSMETDEEVPQSSTNSQKAQLHKASGTQLYQAGDWQGACREYGLAISLEPQCAIYYGNRAAASFMLGRFKDALEDSQTSVKLDPSYARGYQRSAKALLTLGRTEEAKENYEAALRCLPSDQASKEGLTTVKTVSANLEAGRKALEKGDARIALWHADIALRAASPAVEPAQMLKVQALSALGRHAEALSDSRALTVEGSASHPDVLAVRAGTLYSAGNMQLAERIYQEALRMDPDSTASRKGIKRLRSMNSAKEAGNEAFKQGKWSQARDCYTSAVETDPSLKSSFMVQCLSNRAAAALKLSMYGEALSDAERAIELDPDFAKAYLRRAAAQTGLEDYEAAVRDYEKVKSLAPDTPEIGRLLQDAKVALAKSKRVDYYKILGISPSAGQDEIKKAYKKMALKLHPDKVPDGEREEAEKRFKQLTAGHTILSDPTKRRQYDAGWNEEEIEQGGRSAGFGASGFGGGGFGGGGFGGFSEEDLYAQLFSQMRGGGGGFRSSGFH